MAQISHRSIDKKLFFILVPPTWMNYNNSSASGIQAEFGGALTCTPATCIDGHGCLVGCSWHLQEIALIMCSCHVHWENIEHVIQPSPLMGTEIVSNATGTDMRIVNYQTLVTTNSRRSKLWLVKYASGKPFVTTRHTNK